MIRNNAKENVYGRKMIFLLMILRLISVAHHLQMQISI